MCFSQALEVDSPHDHLGDLGEISCSHWETDVVYLTLTPNSPLCSPWKERKNLCKTTTSSVSEQETPAMGQLEASGLPEAAGNPGFSLQPEAQENQDLAACIRSQASGSSWKL